MWPFDFQMAWQISHLYHVFFQIIIESVHFSIQKSRYNYQSPLIFLQQNLQETRKTACRVGKVRTNINESRRIEWISGFDTLVSKQNHQLLHL
jgi:hypothetical protein